MQVESENLTTPSSLTCPSCDAPLDRQRFDVVNLKFRQSITSALQTERRDLKMQFDRDVAAATKAVQDRAAEQMATSRRESDAAVKFAEESARTVTKQAEEAVRAVNAARDAAVNAGVAAEREKWDEAQRALLEKKDGEARSRELVLNDKVAALARQDESRKRAIQDLETQLKESAERGQEATRRFDADKKAAVDAARASEQAKHVESIAAAAAEVRAAKEREAAAIANGTEATKAADARVQEAIKATETKTREVLQVDHQRILGERAAEVARDREGLMGHVKNLERRITDLTANQIGDGAELDLVGELRNAFEDDSITRVPKGTPGADIHQEVRVRGQAIGLIILDSKDRKSWRFDYATKLRQDQIDAGADHAVLSTTVFPSGKRAFCVESGVIVSAPRHVVEMVRILRDEIIRTHRLRLSNEERSGKRELLYRYISSGDFHNKVEELERLHRDLLDLEVSDKTYHDKTWRNRGWMLRQLQRGVSDIQNDLAEILENNVIPMERET